MIVYIKAEFYFMAMSIRAWNDFSIVAWLPDKSYYPEGVCKYNAYDV